MNVDILSEDLAVSKSSSKDKQFDAVIGHIEDIVVSEGFQEMQTKFMNNHCNEFDDSEENKLSYTTIFNDYAAMFEKFIEGELQKRMTGFSMKDFMKQLLKRPKEISEELLEMLSSFTDFLVFKELMIDHRAFTEGRVADFSMDLTIRPVKNVERDEK